MLLDELSRYIGQTVTIFTTSGGASGFGFTGVLLRINLDFITLVNRLGSPPNTSVGEVPCDTISKCDIHRNRIFVVSSLCDIPLNKVAAFCHNAL